MADAPSNPIQVGRLTCKKPAPGGQVEAVITEGLLWYIQVFGTVEGAQAFAEVHNLEFVPPPEDEE